MKPLLLSSLLGAVVAFLWGMISWMVLPWHDAQIKKFTDEAKVAEVVKANAPVHGIYVMPYSDKTQSMEQAMRAMQAGPFAYAVVRPGEKNVSMGTRMAISFGIQFVGAFLLSALLLCVRPMRYWGRVMFVVLAALAGGILSHLPPWNWWETPDHWTLTHLADLAIGWALAGMVLARFANPARVAQEGGM